MPIIFVRIPQLGEGLQEALLVEFLKEPGDAVERDEPIYVMETDKAVTEVESPYKGTLVEWVVETSSVLPIGAEVARMEVAEGVKEMSAGHKPAELSTAADAVAAATAPNKLSIPIPPRTRKYLKEKGLLAVADEIPAAGAKLMVEDVDRYLSEQGGGASVGVGAEAYEERALSPSQIALNFRLVRGVQACVPVTGVIDVDADVIVAARKKLNEAGLQITGFGLICWCMVQTIAKHDRFRSTLSADGKTLRTYPHVQFGIAVARPGDELITAVIRDADTLNREEFCDAYNHHIQLARDGKDQVDESTTFTTSNIGKVGLRMGIPVVVPPAVATLAVGEVRNEPIPTSDGFEFHKRLTMSLTFDHRVINGVGAGKFLKDLRETMETFEA
ncbi:MAG: 2-oxo acid dehydrogenase subunit E2 [Planctomycetes bacterium]|nr:2-oxo acid dehydrogenase subunit E2 [Planctomycetota bacterium]